MKRLIILLTGLILLVCLSSCSKGTNEDFYGTYKFEKVVYLSPLSSSRADYLNEKLAGTKYTIEEDLFKVEPTDNNFEITPTSYVKEEIPEPSSPFSLDIHALLGNDVKYQYTIHIKDGKTNWRLYASPDSLWVATFVDNTADGSEIIMNIYKLSK